MSSSIMGKKIVDTYLFMFMILGGSRQVVDNNRLLGGRVCARGSASLSGAT